MSWPPPSVLPTNRENTTPQEDEHPSDHNIIHGAINKLSGFLHEHSVLKPGMVMEYMGEVPPPNWVILVGQTITDAANVYPDFWDAIPSAMKSGDDAIMPDTRLRVSVGLDSANVLADAIGKLGGNADVPIVTHNHNVDNHTHGAGNLTGNIAHSHPITHNHSINNHNHNINSHTHNIGNHSHGIAHNHNLNSHSHGISGSNWSFVRRGSSYTNGNADFRVNAGNQIQLGWRNNTNNSRSNTGNMNTNNTNSTSNSNTGNANSNPTTGNQNAQNTSGQTGNSTANTGGQSGNTTNAMNGSTGNQNAAVTTGTIEQADEAGAEKNFPPFVTLAKMVYLGAAA